MSKVAERLLWHKYGGSKESVSTPDVPTETSGVPRAEQENVEASTNTPCHHVVDVRKLSSGDDS